MESKFGVQTLHVKCYLCIKPRCSGNFWSSETNETALVKLNINLPEHLLLWSLLSAMRNSTRHHYTNPLSFRYDPRQPCGICSSLPTSCISGYYWVQSHNKLHQRYTCKF